jgi:hypothetical protein
MQRNSAKQNMIGLGYFICLLNNNLWYLLGYLLLDGVQANDEIVNYLLIDGDNGNVEVVEYLSSIWSSV